VDRAPKCNAPGGGPFDVSRELLLAMGAGGTGLLMRWISHDCGGDRTIYTAETGGVRELQGGH
jgi:hypothetical protein